jgi:hypothetical protein
MLLRTLKAWIGFHRDQIARCPSSDPHWRLQPVYLSASFQRVQPPTKAFSTSTFSCAAAYVREG